MWGSEWVLESAGVNGRFLTLSWELRLKDGLGLESELELGALSSSPSTTTSSKNL